MKDPNSCELIRQAFTYGRLPSFGGNRSTITSLHVHDGFAPVAAIDLWPDQRPVRLGVLPPNDGPTFATARSIPRRKRAPGHNSHPPRRSRRGIWQSDRLDSDTRP